MEEVQPRCDICDEPEDNENGFVVNDWNGETGNHLSCESNTLTLLKHLADLIGENREQLPPAPPIIPR